jgi:peptidoglycan/LPS O-acetylase OafA/YrhL
MSVNRLVLKLRTWIALAVGWVALFIIAGAAFNGHTHVDNVVWPIVFILLLVVVLLGVFSLVQSRRSRAH